MWIHKDSEIFDSLATLLYTMDALPLDTSCASLLVSLLRSFVAQTAQDRGKRLDQLFAPDDISRECN